MTAEPPAGPPPRSPWPARGRALGYLVVAAASAGWLYAAGWTFFTPVYVPDEFAFNAEARRYADRLKEVGPVEFVRTQQNFVGYGSAYWIGYAAVIRAVGEEPPDRFGELNGAFPPSFVVMRAVAFGCFLAIPVCAWAAARRAGNPVPWPALLVWLAMSMAWWTGKLTGPELYSVAAGLVGVALAVGATRTATLFGCGLLLGVATAVKPNGAVLAVYAVTAAALAPGRVRAVLALGAGAAAGFVLANPFLLAGDLKPFVANLPKPRPDGPAYTRAHLHAVLFSDVWVWDVVYSGGLFRVGLAPLPSALLAAAVTLRGGLTALAPLVAAAAASTVLVAGSDNYLGWYWFPLLALYPLALARAGGGRAVPPPRAGVALALVLVAVGVNAWQRAGLAAAQIEVRQKHWRTIRAAGDIAGRVDRWVETLPARPAVALDYTFYDVKLDLRSVPRRRRHWEPNAMLQAVQRPGPKTVPVLLVASVPQVVMPSMANPHSVFRPLAPDNPFGCTWFTHIYPEVCVYGYLVSPEAAADLLR